MTLLEHDGMDTRSIFGHLVYLYQIVYCMDLIFGTFTYPLPFEVIFLWLRILNREMHYHKIIYFKGEVSELPK